MPDRTPSEDPTSLSPPDVFRTTQWTLLKQLEAEQAEHRDAAAGRLASLYWLPVYTWFRRKGHSQADSEELTQAFFEQVVLGRRLFERAKQEKGRLRSLICASLRNFEVDEIRRRVSRPFESASKASLSFAETLVADSSAADPTSMFDREWALAVIQAAMATCREHFESSGRTMHWRLFEDRVLRPLQGAALPPPLHVAFAEYDFESAGQAAAAVQTVKRRLQVMVWEVIAESADDEDARMEEYNLVAAALKGASSGQ